MIKIFISLLIFVLVLPVSAQFVVPSIPDSLIENANEIVISDETDFTIKDIGHSTLKRKYSTAVLNKYAEYGNNITLHYNEFIDIIMIVVNVYNNHGKRVERYYLSDFEDWTDSFYATASDSRRKILNIKQKQYPYYVDVEYKIEYDGSLHLPYWHPQDAEKQSLLSASLVIESPIQDLLSFQCVNIDPPHELFIDDKHFYRWELENLPAFEKEALSGSIENYIPIVYSALKEFQLDGYQGKMTSWKEFGNWIDNLNFGRNNLNPEQISEVLLLTAKASTDLEKAKIIYKYVQDNMHYVSIQLGIGGWQPFETAFVHETKYGDCKALSFYTHSLLKAAGVESYYTIIRSGANASKLSSDFPNAYFNHAIVSVVCDTDTIWLECTSQTAPFGYLGKFTSDRYALMVDENGGELIRTKSYTSEEN
ncbi:MAG: transglutaminase domain-containing protein, partial [Bacteroidales bacterium]|nr:transglutaminase domain-containing protein [Bacteroidales bacterium]